MGGRSFDGVCSVGMGLRERQQGAQPGIKPTLAPQRGKDWIVRDHENVRHEHGRRRTYEPTLTQVPSRSSDYSTALANTNNSKIEKPPRRTTHKKARDAWEHSWSFFGTVFACQEATWRNHMHMHSV